MPLDIYLWAGLPRPPPEPVPWWPHPANARQHAALRPGASLQAKPGLGTPRRSLRRAA